MKNLIIAIMTMVIVVGCKSQKATGETNANANRPRSGERGERPSVDKIFEMDTNKDGKLAKSEVKGPLERDFAKIDSNGDGFITKAELKNAPKPQRGQRPSRNK